MKINEVFKGIQGEGAYAGRPMLFIRTSGCTRKCSYCDTQYHKDGDDKTIDELSEIIIGSRLEYVCWTGGEPTMWVDEISKVIKKTDSVFHHLETNGDLDVDYSVFDYVACSPKGIRNYQPIIDIISNVVSEWDIKVVTDLKKNKNLIKYATMLMPLTTDSKKENTKIKREVWNYCVENKINYCLRQHVEVWGSKKGV